MGANNHRPKLTRETVWRSTMTAAKSFWNFIRKGGYLLFIAFFLDLITKLALQASLDVGERIPLITDGDGNIILGLTLTYNTGMGYGFLEGQRALLATLSGVAGAIMVAYLIYHFDRKSWPLRYGLYLMIAGCFGNFIDRAFYPQGVIDWIQIGNSYWPSAFTFVCNIADIALTAGVIVLIVGLIVVYTKEEIRAKRAKQVREESEASAAAPTAGEVADTSEDEDYVSADLSALDSALQDDPQARKDEEDESGKRD